MRRVQLDMSSVIDVVCTKTKKNPLRSRFVVKWKHDIVKIIRYVLMRVKFRDTRGFYFDTTWFFWDPSWIKISPTLGLLNVFFYLFVKTVPFSEQWRIQGALRTPLSVQFLSFSCIFWQFLKKNRCPATMVSTLPSPRLGSPRSATSEEVIFS